MIVYGQLVLVDYVAGSFNQLSLWSLSGVKDTEYGCICVANNTTLIWEVNLSIKLVVRKPGADPTPSQLWNISPQFGSVCCKPYSNRALGIKDGNLNLVLADSTDKTQVYIYIHLPYSMCVLLWNLCFSVVMYLNLLL